MGDNCFHLAGFMPLLHVAPEPRRIITAPLPDPLGPGPEYHVDDQQDDDACYKGLDVLRCGHFNAYRPLQRFTSYLSPQPLYSQRD